MRLVGREGVVFDRFGKVRFCRPGGLIVLCVGLVVALASLWLGVAAGGGGTAATASSRHFRTRPDLRPPQVTILHRSSGTSPGYVFLAPKSKVAQAGPLIIDDSGQVVWFDPRPRRVEDFKVQTYRGKPVLTWWEFGGAYTIMDSSYRVIKVVHAGNRLIGNNHDFQVTPQGTAYMTISHKVTYDLSSVGGPRRGYLLEGVVQEVSVATGRVLFQWDSASEISPKESYLPIRRAGVDKDPYDYFHINSIQVESNGNLLVSSRNTHAVYEIRRSDGAILWRLGGKKSDFTFGPGARFAWQHDARRQPDGTLTLFDNNADTLEKGLQSRALVLRLDLATHRVTLVRAYAHRPPLLSASQGNQQRLPDGHVFVGWGSNPYFTEYTADGRVLLDGRFHTGGGSYRAFRFLWVGRPTTRPAIAVDYATNGQTRVYASWNGATQVARWQVLAGPDAQHLSIIASAAKSGFETALSVRTSSPYVAVRALDAQGAVLGNSPAVRNSG